MDLNLVNLSVDFNGKDLQRCTTDGETYKTVLYSNGSMDPNLENLCVDSYDKNLQSCTTEVEMLKLFFPNGWMACLAINSCLSPVTPSHTYHTTFIKLSY